MSMAGAEGTAKPERAPVNEHGLTDSSQNGNTQGRNQFGLQDGLHPLQELDTNDTSATRKEEKEIQQREHEEQQKFYDQYRNPIARFRAQYPQAPAEFLAVSIPSNSVEFPLTTRRLSFTSFSGYPPIFPLQHRRSKLARSSRKRGRGVLQSL